MSTELLLVVDPRRAAALQPQARPLYRHGVFREGQKWLDATTIWLYRGAWMEWELGRVDMAVPLSPDELIKKRHAIFRHLSQKDIVPFPGDDPREFWQRAEDRTQTTAASYNDLGMAEYQAIEVFLKLK